MGAPEGGCMATAGAGLKNLKENLAQLVSEGVRISEGRVDMEVISITTFG